MSVTGSPVFIKIDGERPAGLSSPLETFYMDSAIAGDSSGGLIEHVFHMNPSATTSRTYVAITGIWINNAAAMSHHAGLNVSQYDEWTVAGVFASINIDFVTAGTASGRMVTPDRPVYLGKVKPGTVGQVSVVNNTNTNGVTYSVHIRGIRSSNPFVIPLTYTSG